MAVHKGKIIRPAPVGGGIRRPQFRVSRPTLQGAYFDLLAPRDSRRTIMVQTKTSIRVSNQHNLKAGVQSIVINRLNQNSDAWQVLAQALQQTSSSALRITHPRQHALDTAFRISAPRSLVADSAQNLKQTVARTAEAGLTVFNVIINEQHEIQT